MLSLDARNWRTLTWFRLKFIVVQTGVLTAVNTGGFCSVDAGLIWSSWAFALGVFDLVFVFVVVPSISAFLASLGNS
jgi:hypothetical protein